MTITEIAERQCHRSIDYWERFYRAAPEGSQARNAALCRMDGAATELAILTGFWKEEATPPAQRKGLAEDERQAV